jgi:hypothetical protein
VTSWGYIHVQAANEERDRARTERDQALSDRLELLVAIEGHQQRGGSPGTDRALYETAARIEGKR